MTKKQKSHLTSALITFLATFLTFFSSGLMLVDPTTEASVKIGIGSAILAGLNAAVRGLIKYLNELTEKIDG